MEHKIIIRHEVEADYFAAESITRSAFWNVYMPGAEEHYLLHRLRNDSDYLPNFSFVAESEGKIVGGIYYEKATLKRDDGKEIPILTFGPLGVDPAYQRQNVGSLLVQASLEATKKTDYPAIVITGVPAYYPRFGFRHCDELSLRMSDGTQFPALMGLELKKGFFGKGHAYTFFEPYILTYRPKQKEIDIFDKEFPPLEKKRYPSQWKPINN